MSQTVPVFEIIVVDDGSTDQGGWIVREKQYGNVRVIRQKNQGVSAARNRGIIEAVGDYIAFIDADDIWAPHFLAELEMLIRSFPEANFFATGYQKKLANDEYISPKLSSRLCQTQPHILDNYFEVVGLGDLPFTASSFAINRQLIERCGFFPEGEPMGEDQWFFSAAALNGKIAYSPRVLSYYQIQAENRACVDNLPREECPFSKRLMATATVDIVEESLRQDILRYTAAHLLHLAKVNARFGQYKVALSFLKDSRCWKKPLHKIYWEVYCRIMGGLSAMAS